MSALDEQVGGEHYKGMVIQPVEFIQKNRLGFVEGNIIKYICRWRAKNGIEDLHKVRHYIDLLIDLESAEAVKEPDESESEDNRFYIDGKEVPYPDFLASYGPSPKLREASIAMARMSNATPLDWDIAFQAATKSDRNT